MYIKKLKVKNYKIFKNMHKFAFNQDKNIFIGNNGTGKSCILESIEIGTNGTVNGSNLKYNLRSSMFNNEIVEQYEELLNKFNNRVETLIEINTVDKYKETILEIYKKYEENSELLKKPIETLEDLIKVFLEKSEQSIDEDENPSNPIYCDLKEILELIEKGISLKDLIDKYYMSQKLLFFIMHEEIFSTPEILIEIYIEDVDEEFRHIEGTNNSISKSEYGIKTIISLSPSDRVEYYDYIIRNKLLHMPINFYSIKREYFNGNKVYKSPFDVGIINTLTHNKGGINKILGRNIDSLSSEVEKNEVGIDYISKRYDFEKGSGLKQINNNLKDMYKKIDQDLKITLKERDLNYWIKELSLYRENIIFENLGYGEQNYINILMSLYYPNSDVNILIIEEPENSLSFSKMNELLKKIEDGIKNTQIFISTHSNYITNKLGLKNVHILSKSKNNKINHKNLSSLKDEDKDFFNKLPGYDTLRLILSKKIVLVEGRSDELIITRHYLDRFGKLPIDDGIDILSVEGLSFKRFCRLCELVDKDVYVVTDNDRKSYDEVKDEYKGFSNKIHLFVEKDKKLNTLEPSLLEVNFKHGDFNTFKNIIYKIDPKNKTKKDVLNTMLRAKSEWAYKVYISKDKIEYPDYIKDLVEQIGE